MKPGLVGLVLLALLSVVSCVRLTHPGIIPQKKFVSVLVDLQLADGIAVENIANRSAPLLDSATMYTAVFSKHGVTRAQFDSTMKYYTQHPEDFQQVYNLVTAQLKELEDNLKGNPVKEEEDKVVKPKRDE